MPDVVPTPSPVPAQEPAGMDAPFSEMFAPQSVDVQPTTAPTNANEPSQTAPAAQPTSAQPTPQSFEIRTKTGTVYKSVDDAVKGIEHKDSMIEQLRQYAIQNTGIDPITGRQMQPQAPSVPQQPQQSDSYLQNQQKYFEDLYSAYQRNDPQAYLQVQQKLIEEKTMAQFQPIFPVLQQFAQTTAISKVGSEIKEFQNFYNSSDYQDTLQKYPTLAQAISASEQNMQYANQLPDLYKMVYQLNQANKLPELLKTATLQTPETLTAARPTTAPSTLTPPQSTSYGNVNMAQDADARKAFIEAFEKSGKADNPFPRR